jgi:hypothetical protein
MRLLRDNRSSGRRYPRSRQELRSLAAQRAPGGETGNAQQDRTKQVQQRMRQRPAIVAALQQRHRFAGKAGEGRQAAEEIRDDEQAPLGRQLRMMREEGAPSGVCSFFHNSLGASAALKRQTRQHGDYREQRKPA